MSGKMKALNGNTAAQGGKDLSGRAGRALQLRPEAGAE